VHLSIVAYLDGLQAKVNALRELQSQSQEELDALLPPPTGMISVLDRSVCPCGRK